MRARLTWTMAGLAVATVLGAAFAVPMPRGLEYPAPVTDEEATAWMDDVADATWRSTGLEGRLPRPDVAYERPAYDQAPESLSDCMQDAGQELTSYGFNTDQGYVLGSNGEPASEFPDEEQYTWYRCVVSTMPDPRGFGDFMTPEQQVYERHHQIMHVVPCLIGNGVDVDRAAVDAAPLEFRISGFYFVMTELEPSRREHLSRLCGPEFLLSP